MLGSELKFNKTLMQMRFGVVRLTPEMRIIDKNEVADKLFALPKRNSSIAKLLDDPRELEALKNEKGAAVTCRLKGNGKIIGVIAIREKSENIILFFHPFLVAVCSDFICIVFAFAMVFTSVNVF